MSGISPGNPSLRAAAPLILPFQQECLSLLLLPLTFVHVHCCWVQTCVAVSSPVVSASNRNLIHEGAGTPYLSRQEFPCFGARNSSLLLLISLWLAAGFPAVKQGDAFLLAAPCPVSCLLPVPGLGHLDPCVPVVPGASVAFGVFQPWSSSVPWEGDFVRARQVRAPLSSPQQRSGLGTSAGGSRGCPGQSRVRPLAGVGGSSCPLSSLCFTLLPACPLLWWAAGGLVTTGDEADVRSYRLGTICMTMEAIPHEKPGVEHAAVSTQVPGSVCRGLVVRVQQGTVPGVPGARIARAACRGASGGWGVDSAWGSGCLASCRTGCSHYVLSSCLSMALRGISPCPSSSFPSINKQKALRIPSFHSFVIFQLVQLPQ